MADAWNQAAEAQELSETANAVQRLVSFRRKNVIDIVFMVLLNYRAKTSTKCRWAMKSSRQGRMEKKQSKKMLEVSPEHEIIFYCYHFCSIADASLLMKIIRKGLIDTKNDLDIQRKDPNSPLYSVKTFEALHL